MSTLTTREPPDETAHGQRVRERARGEFDRWALSYDRSLLNEVVFFPAIRRCQEEILRWKRERERGAYRVLDIGCGTGRLLHLLARDADAERLVGLDYSPVMVRRAVEKLDEPGARFIGAHERLSFVVGDSERLPFADGMWDVVTCCHSFHHYPHQARAVAEFRRVLRPGGMLVLIDGFRDNFLGWMIFEVGVRLAEGQVHHARAAAVKRMALEAGFATVRQAKINVLAPLLVTVGRV